MKHVDIIRAYPNITSIIGEDAFDADGNPVQYDESVVQAYIDAHAYIEKRQQAYPSIADQLDLMYHGGYDAWKAAIEAVKQEYPKP